MGSTLQYINPIEVLQYQYKGWKSKKKMGLTLQYINPIEVLQYQYKGWKSRHYHIQIVGFYPTQLGNDLIIYFGK